MERHLARQAVILVDTAIELKSETLRTLNIEVHIVGRRALCAGVGVSQHPQSDEIPVASQVLLDAPVKEGA